MEALLDALVAAMATIGVAGVGAATALETVFPPVPSEVVLPLAGYTAYQGEFGVIAAIVSATIGSYVGALVLYYLGAAWGLRRVCATADRLPLVSSEDVRRGAAAFARHGRAAVFFGRLMPGVRSVISIPAGIDRMPLVTFSLYTIAGSAVWNVLLIGAGYELGAQWHLVERYVGAVSNVAHVLIALAVVVFAARRLRNRQRHGGGTHGGGERSDEGRSEGPEGRSEGPEEHRAADPHAREMGVDIREAQAFSGPSRRDGLG